MVRVGLLALQGSFEAHARCFAQLGVATTLVRLPDDLASVSHVVIPGGESTTMHHLMEFAELHGALRDRHDRGASFWGTCAGAILLGRESVERPPRLSLIDIDAQRNAYGRQIASFTRDLHIPAVGRDPFHAVFIRAPRFAHPGKRVQVLAKDGDAIVLAREGRVLVSAFHPELTADTRLHQWFLGMATEGAPL
ncbi:MAG: pyridoxal 5'-phosphate synthase glutaminase subunit PdxT [Planctomycetota bacterium]